MVAKESTALVPIEKRALAQFEVTPESVAERVKEFEDLHVTPGDPKSYKQVKAAYMVIVHLRNDVAKRCKDLADEPRKWIKALKKASEKLIEPTAPLEARLKAELDEEDKRLADIEAEKVLAERERVAGIRKKIDEVLAKGSSLYGKPAADLEARWGEVFEVETTPEEFGEFVEEAEHVKTSVLGLLKNAIREQQVREEEMARLEKQRVEQEAENKRLADEKAQLEADKKALEDAKKAEQEQKEKEALEKKEAEEAKAKAEQDAKEKAEAEEKERQNKAAQAPDKDKLQALANQLEAAILAPPEIQSEAGKIVLEDTLRAVRGVIAMIRKQTQYF